VNRAIEWFARNPVAANLLMLIILVGGGITVFSIRQEVFPEFSTDTITVTVPYLGAAPEEVEEGVCIRIEEQIQGINGIKKITSKSSEGSGAVTIELLEGADIRTVLDEVKARVDAIETFPEGCFASAARARPLTSSAAVTRKETANLRVFSIIESLRCF